LIITRGFGLAYGGFSDAMESQQAKVGLIARTLSDRRWVGLLVWASVAAIAVGALLLAVPNKG